jgi:hypothetical protein
MQSITRLSRVALILACGIVFSGYARGASLIVHCGGKGALSTINGALKMLHPDEPNTITVSGTCNENVVIQSFDRLTLISTAGSTINDVSGGLSAVVGIADSHRVTLQGFTINGGIDGVICGSASVCYLTANTVQSSAGQEGVFVTSGARAFLTGNVIQNNGQRGLTVNGSAQVFSSTDIFRDNADIGIVANSGAYLAATNSIVQNNGSDGSDGVLASDRSILRLVSCTISGNTLNGVTLQHSSEARFDSFSGPSTVSGNGGSGVVVRDLSFGFFGQGNTITGNLGGTDVLCAPQFSATKGALTNIGGGTTNCIEP